VKEFISDVPNVHHWPKCIRVRKKTRVFFKKPNQVGFLGFIGFLDKQEKIGKIIQKLSNLKP